MVNDNIKTEITFEGCLKECFLNDEFRTQFNRLTGNNVGFSAQRNQIEKMIDEATGYDKTIHVKETNYMHEFTSFVFTYVWIPFLQQAINDNDTV